MNAKVEFIAPVRHNKKKYSAGDVFVMPEAQAKRLVSLGFAKILETVEGETQNQGPKTGGAGEQNPTPPATSNKGDDALNDPRNFQSMKIEEIQQELSVLGIAHKATATKDELLKKLLEAQKAKEAKGSK